MSEISQDTAEKLKFAERQKIVDDWKSGVEFVVNETKDPRAQELQKFMSKHAVYGVPLANDKSQYFYTEEPTVTEDQLVVIVALIEEDRQKLGPDDSRMEIIEGVGTELARYNEGSNNIYLPDIAMNKQAKGLILLHELAHAKWHMDINRKTTEKEDLHEEADISKFEAALAVQLNGLEYKKWLVELRKKITFSSKESVESFEYKVTSSDESFLREYFKPLSDAEHRFWVYLSVVAAVEHAA